MLWQKVNDSELRVRMLDEGRPPGPAAMRGFARRFRDTRRSTADWMRELREGES